MDASSAHGRAYWPLARPVDGCEAQPTLTGLAEERRPAERDGLSVAYREHHFEFRCRVLNMSEYVCYCPLTFGSAPLIVRPYS